MNGIPVELPRDASFRFVFAEAEHSDAGHEHHGGIGIANCRRFWPRKRRIVSGIFVPIRFERTIQRFAKSRQTPVRSPLHKKRPNFRSNEMIRATRSEMR